MSYPLTRRSFIAASGVAAATTHLAAVAKAEEADSTRSTKGPKLEKEDGGSVLPTFALWGLGMRGQSLLGEAIHFARCVALCDVDTGHLRKGAAAVPGLCASKGRSEPAPALFEDHRLLLDQTDCDVIFIASPDHWHAKMAIDAIEAGKHVYCEKPLTLTVEEGRLILDALKGKDLVFQVGTQQRSDARFQTAAVLAREGRIGAVHRVTCSIGGCPTSGSLPETPPAADLNWNRWLGPAPYVPYREAARLPGDNNYGSEFPYSRAHAHFRWWYEYAGGKLTDWGAHHVDIAMWALNLSDGGIGRFKVDPLFVEHPVEFAKGDPLVDDQFNTATRFHVRVSFENGTELDIRDDATADLRFGNGIMFEGESGRYFVNREKLTGKPVEDLIHSPLPKEAYERLHPWAAMGGGWHLANFFDSINGNSTPVSDVASHHRHLTVCHVVNIAMRLGRALVYDPATETFVDDQQATSMLSRTPRKGFGYQS